MNKTQLANLFDHKFLKAYAKQILLNYVMRKKKSDPLWLQSIQLGRNSVKNN